jgi:tetratricopeptide (TPR) repeat protein
MYLVVLLLTGILQSKAQDSKTYAVIIGISNYQELPSLDYAHRDAQAFADFLHSSNGGSVPLGNITLLLNEQATIAAISLAFEKIIDAANKNDTVYIYFSGHGDVDLHLAHNPGFLLAYDTPKDHYLQNAIEIDGFNNYIVNTLSVKKEAAVIVITDACHSGKLTEKGFNNSKLAAEQLRHVRNKEIRLTSCASDQLSQEDARWGKGRGVFSYYLINGLNGAARIKSFGAITLGQLSIYLDSALAKDAILKEKKGKQTPVFNGNKAYVFNNPVAQNMGDGLAANTVQIIAPVLEKPLSAVFFNQLAKFPLEKIFDYQVLDTINLSLIASYCIDKVADSVQKALHNGIFQQEERFDIVKSSTLKKILHENNYLAKQFNQKLAQIFGDNGQAVINAYLKGDAEELEKRKYYNIKNNNYEVYPKMFAIALKLLKSKDGKYTGLEQQLQVKQYYFSGIAERLRLPFNKDKSSILQKAIALQLKAFALEEDADYIQNELGLLYFINKDYKKAETFFTKATELNPNWAIPLSNLAGVYVELQKTDTGLVLAEKAIALQPDYRGAYEKQAMLYEQKNNLLAAEELYKKSLLLNVKDYFSFEKLGKLYLKTGRFEKADKFLSEADKRKKGIYPLPDAVGDGVADSFDTDPETSCNLIEQKIVPKPTDALLHIALGLEYLIFKDYQGDFINAERCFRIAIKTNPTNHLAYHYLGKALFFQNHWQEAELNFKNAIRYYVPNQQYDHYIDSTLLLQQTPYANCIKKKIKENYYAAVGDYFCLGDNFTAWGQYQEAEIQFRKAIAADNTSLSGYYKLWNLLMAQGKYTDAENVFINYYNVSKTSFDYSGINYMASFYNQIIQIFPDNPYWVYKAGSFYFTELSNGERYSSYLENYIPVLDSNETDKKNENLKIDFAIAQNEKESLEGYGRKMIIPGKLIINYQQKKITNPKKEIPGTREIINKDVGFDPYAEGYHTLLKAVSLFQDNEEMLADIYEKLGGLMQIEERYTEAMQFYKKAVFFKPDNVNYEMKFIENAIACFYYRNALEALNDLYSQKKLTFGNQLTRADFLIRSGQLAESEAALRTLTDFKDSMINTTLLKMHLAYLKNNYAEATTLAIAVLKESPNDIETFYTIAHLFAKQNKKKEAFDWLQKSVDQGLSFLFLVNTDPVWDAWKTNPRWQEIVRKIKPKKYKLFQRNDLRE